ncbi:MAG: type II secretion system GspH family protein [Patescibacteria group bacterium]|nr:type II secretion system GspH family protein [Patescibacteria group bacterium]
MKGFTLIELLIAIFVTVIIFAVAGDVLVSVLRSSNKSNILNEISQNADFVLNSIESTARNGKCAYMSSGNLVIVDQFNQVNIFSFGPNPNGSGSSVFKQAGVGTPAALTNTDLVGGVDVDRSASSFNVLSDNPLSCTAKRPLIQVVLRLRQAPNASSRIDYQAGSTFYKSIEVRNY